MKLRRLKHMLLRLSTEEKVLGIGALMVLVGTFLPWYSVIFSYEDKSILESGFSGHLGVVGFVIFLLTLLSVSFLIADHLSIKLPKFGLKKEQIIMFLMGESAFLILLMVAVNVKRSLEYTNAELRFGLYLSLIGSLVGAFAAFSQIQKNQKKDVEAFFGQTEEEVAVQTVTETEDEETLPHNEEPTIETENIIKDPVKQVEQKSFFYEENSDSENKEELSADNDELPEIINELNDEEEEEEPYKEVEKVEQTLPTDRQVDEDEIVEGAEEPEVEEKEETEEEAPAEEVEEETEEEPEVEKKEEITNEESSEQGNYFIREAGVAIGSEAQARREKKSNIKVDMESIKKVENEEIKPQKKENKPSNENLSIYDDM